MSEVFSWAAVTGVYAVMLLAASVKVQDMRNFEEAVLAIPRVGHVWVARLVPAVEIAVGLSVVASPRVGGWLFLCFLSVATGYLVRSIRQGAPCNCFGSTRRARPRDVVRNLVLACLGVLIVALGSPRDSATSWMLAAGASGACVVLVLLIARNYDLEGRAERVH